MRIYKFGRGKNLSAYMNDKNNIDIFYFDKGIKQKNVQISSDSLSLHMAQFNLAYNNLIKIDDNLYVSNINKNISIQQY